MHKRAWIRTLVAPSAALVLTLGAGATARAQSSKVAAEALFDDAIKLMKAGQYDAACPKLADSERLDPAANTLLNLAACYEKQGRTASAWETYKEAEAAERDAHHDQYQQLAHDRATALEPNLPKMTINALSQPADGTVIKLDGTAVPVSEWGLPVPVDPGSHVIEVSAPNKKTWSQSVTIGMDAVTTPAAVNVPQLEDAPATATTTPATGTATTGTAVTPQNPPPASPPAPDRGVMSTQRTVAVIVGGVGVIGLGLGTIFAIQASSKNSDSKNDCLTSSPNQCSSAGVSLRNTARSDGNIASIGLGAGAALLVTGVVLWFTGGPGPEAPAQAGKIEVLPTLGGAMVQGVW